jgi:hypothetical protein
MSKKCPVRTRVDIEIKSKRLISGLTDWELRNSPDEKHTTYFLDCLEDGCVAYNLKTKTCKYLK